MKYLNPLFLSDNIPSEEKVRQRLARRAGVAGLYLVCLSDREDELFVLYPDEEFMHAPYEACDVTVVGLAIGYITAKNLVKNIIAEIFEKEGRIDRDAVQDFFAERAGEGSL